MGKTRDDVSTILDLNNIYNNPDKEALKNDIEKYDITTKTLYPEGKQNAKTAIEGRQFAKEIRISFEEKEYAEVIHEMRRHHVLKGEDCRVGDYVEIVETQNWQGTGRKVSKKIVCITPGDGEILKEGYCIVQW